MAIQRGDYEIGLKAKDNLGISFNWNDLSDYTISVYQNCNGIKNEPLFIFKKGATGIASITIDSLDNTLAYIIINRKLTANIPAKELFLEIEVSITQSGNYIGGKATAIETAIPLFQLDQSSNRNKVLW
ncbi:MAG: hypothetical protein ABI241_00455 [Bacteroidia bacterium]